ncbi:substrate-binding domain-containing protein [Myroides sp. LJL110]
MKKVNIIGVPEHFNLPWLMSIKQGDFHSQGIDLQWTDIPQGTGKMCQMLRDKQTDLAIILSEGIITDITKDNPSRIIQKYVDSPLIWGIHVAYDSSFQDKQDLKNKRIAISRYGSGSHLMAIVHAKQMGWNIEDLQFVIVDTLEGAIKELNQKQADYFMWEKFMTQPIVDQKIFRRIGQCPTPWPSFVIVAHTDFIENHPDELQTILKVINKQTKQFKSIADIDKLLANTYQQKLQDIQKWLDLTFWSEQNLSIQEFDSIQNQMHELGLIQEKVSYQSIVL